MGQLDLTHFQRPQASELRSLDTPLQPYQPALNDECRVREGDILPPPKQKTEIEDPSIALSYRVPSALKGIDLSAITSRPQLLASLTNNIPQNEYNLPRFLYRADLLDYTLFTQKASEDPQLETEHYREMQEQLDASTVPLEFYEGYPALNGSPIWYQLPFEAPTDFALFTKYLEIPGARSLALISNATNGLTLQDLQELYHLYYWGYRSLAHDTFAIAHFQRLRQQRILNTDNVHFLEAERLLTTLQKQFNEIKWEMVQDPEVYVNLLEKVAKLQRLALGQSATNDKAQTQTPSLEVIMRTLTAQDPTIARTNSNTQKGAQEILSDPELTDAAQELIIRYNGNASSK